MEGTAAIEEGPSADGGDARSRLKELDKAFRAYLERQFPEGGASTVEDEPPAPDGPLSSRPLTRLLELSRAMNRIHDRDELLRCVGEGLRELFDAENSFVVLFEEGGRPRILAAHTREDFEGDLPISETILERVRRSEKPILIENTADQPDLRNQSSVELYKIASVLCAPLRVGDKVIGALQFDHRGTPHPFPVGDMRLLSLFADQAATALNNLQLIGWLNEALDEAKQAQGRIVQTERLSALGEMAAGIAHDFNNSLFVALGFCDVLLAKESLESDVGSALQRIRTCALDAANTVRRLQTFARGKQPEDRTTTLDPAAIVEEMVEFTRHKWSDEAQRQGLAIEVRTELEPTPPVRANPAELREVLTNLIFNAVDAMERDGSITLSTRVEAGRVFITVRDEGVGMDAKTRERVFEPFFTTKGARGYGFGLSTCWSIARRLGGEISVESGVGEGSAFTLELPAVVEAVGTELPVRRRTRGQANILVIDDDPDVLHTVEVLVKLIGHKASGFTAPEAALRSFDTGFYDAVVTDLGMPGLSGADVAREVHRRRPQTPVVILTGWGSEVELGDDLAENVTAVLPKPITLEGLRASLSEVLAG